MIIIKIHGGLGNQLFQYAFGKNLSLQYNVPFKINSAYFLSQNQSGRSLGLQNFNTTLIEATGKEVEESQHVFQKIWRRIMPESFRHSGYFEGHYDNESYFKKNWSVIRKDFTLKNPLSPKSWEIRSLIISSPQATSLHIRRGDYVSMGKAANKYASLPLSYYEQAMKTVLEKHPDARFFISSDDISWVRGNFPKNYPVTYMPPDMPDYEELILMSTCKHNIIANSTFSWWGAYLNQNFEKIVIAPKHWFKETSQNPHNSIIKTWMQM